MSLWKHQQEAIAWAVGRRDCIFHMGMGTGKTRVAIEVVLAEIAGKPGCRVLVGCPRAVRPAWEKQFRMWAPHVRVLVLDRGTAKDKDKLVRAALADTTPIVVVGNYETLWRMQVLEKTKFDVLVWDEVHRLKAPSGAASKWAFKMGKANPTAKRLALSGTLLAHALAFDCPVLTPNGWVPIHEIQPGDEVIGSSGSPTTVIGVWPQGVKQLYRVMFSDGDSIECTADHLWSVTSRGRESRGIGPLILRTDELDKAIAKRSGKAVLSSSRGVLDCCSAPRWAIPIMRPAQFSMSADLPIDPYVLGVLLGDGHLGHPIDITTPDQEIVDEVARLLPEGYKPVVCPGTLKGVAKRYRISSGIRGGSEKGPRRGPKKNPVAVAIELLGLRGKTGHHKFIPEQYLFSSCENRLSLLQGLCDTDGSSCETSTSYTTVSKNLADGVRFLAQSLGGYVATSVEQPRLTKLPQGTLCMSSVKYRLTIRTPMCPFRLSRKRNRWVPYRRKPRRGIVSVEAAEQKEAVCITVDASDGLFVADNFIVTHNSPLDAFGTYRSIEGPECPTFGHSYTLFKAKYAIENPHVRGMVVGFRNQEEMARKIAATTFYRRSCDVLDLPPILFDELGFELNAEEAKIYREVETEFCAVCENGTVTPANAMISVLRLAQICGGFVRYDESEAASRITESPAKATRFGEFLEDLDPREKLVVFCRFRSDIDSVAQKCAEHGRTYSELSGRIDRLADWQAGKTNVLIAQIQSGGIGIDCTAAAYGVFYSVGYSLAEYEQAIARLHRPGQTKTTRIYAAVASVHNKPTIERRIYDALRERKDVIDAIVNSYRRSQHAVHGPR